MANKAKAIYKVDGVALINCDLLETHLEAFRKFSAKPLVFLAQGIDFFVLQ